MLQIRSNSRPRDLPQEILDARYGEAAARLGLLPIKVTAFYQRKIDEEVAALGHRGGPLHRIVYPSAERLGQQAPGEVRDFVQDRDNMAPEGGGVVIRKYADRLLFLPTTVCAAHCQYCFRQDVLTAPFDGDPPDLPRRLDLLDDYLAANPAVTEVILSGGDPLTLSARALGEIMERLNRHRRLVSIRLHSRAPVFSPAVLKSDEKIALLAGPKLRLVLHIVHPYELCGEVEALVARLRRAGVRLYNQFPLLRKVNDDAGLLIALLRRLDEIGVRNLSIYAPDPIAYGAAFRIRLQRMFALMDRIWLDSPSWINATAFTLDSPFGKFRREHLVAHDEERGLATFRRGPQEILYHDLPAGLDEPGDPATMLWKGL